MKITLTQEKLTKALNYVSRAVSTKPNIPVLSNILLEVKGSDLFLSATNLDMGIHMWIGGQVDSTGSVTASGKFLSDFISASGSGKVEMNLEGEILKVSHPNASADFQTISADEFPVLPQVGETPLFSVEAPSLIKALDQTVFATSSDLSSSQIQFTGVLFNLSSGANSKLKLVGLDGYRLAENKLDVDRNSTEPLEVIVPARSIQELIKVIGSEKAKTVDVYLGETKSQIVFKFAEIEFSIRLLEGPYPKYEQIMPTQSSYSFEVVKDDLEKALKIVNTFARNLQGYKVDWDIDIETSTLLMRSKVPDLGVNESKVELKSVSGASDLKNSFNLMYLIEMVNHTPGEVISFETNSPLEPAVFKTKEDKGFVHLIMPLERE